MKGVGKAKRARRPAGDQRAGEPPFGTLRWRRAAPAAEDSGLGGLVPLNLGGLFLDRRLQLAAVAGGLLADARCLAGADKQVRSEARRVGKVGGRTCRFRWSSESSKKKNKNQ